MSSDLAAEITAIATAVLAAFALITAILASLAFRKQSREVHDQAEMLRIQSEQLTEQRKLNAEEAKVLELQATELRESLEERKREAAERYRAQAVRVFIATNWREGDKEFGELDCFIPRVVNASDFPIYAVQAWHRDVIDRFEPLLTVLPGEKADLWSHGLDSPEDVLRTTILTFRDAAGVRWIWMPNGILSEQTRDTAQESILAALGMPVLDSLGRENPKQPDTPGE